MKVFLFMSASAIVSVTMLALVDANADANVSGVEGGNRAAPGAAQVGGTTKGPYGGQRTCPVLGEKLGAHGNPIPVTVSGQSIYVCCRGCVNKVQANPAPYLAKVAAERRQSGAATPSAPVKGNQAQSAYGGQKTCPVLDQKLGAHGTPIPLSVGGQTIYVCCRGCVRHVQANPSRYLAKVTAERRQTNGGPAKTEGSPKVVPQD